MSKNKEEKPEKEEKKKPNQLQQFLNAHQEDHYDFIVPEHYLVSTGSLTLDAALSGGLPPGIHRLSGSSEGGKTSESLEILKNFLSTVTNSKALIIKAEGRLSEKIKKRSGIKFVDNAEDWVPGTCYIFKCNIYDTVAQLIYSLVKDNPDAIKYGFLIDSLDGLILKADSQKTFDGDESVKVCGPNVLTKLLFKRLSLPITEYGHMLLVITQIIAKIEAKYDKKEQLVVSGGGGNAAIHFASYILNFQPRYRADLITSDGEKIIIGGKNANFDFGESNIIGHKVNVRLEKTENEKTGIVIEYPIRYATDTHEGGIWTELEIKTVLESMSLVTSKGAWIYISEVAITGMQNAGILEIPDKFHGEPKFNEFVSRPEVVAYWKKRLRHYVTSKELL